MEQERADSVFRKVHALHTHWAEGGVGVSCGGLEPIRVKSDCGGEDGLGVPHISQEELEARERKVHAGQDHSEGDTAGAEGEEVETEERGEKVGAESVG